MTPDFTNPITFAIMIIAFVSVAVAIFLMWREIEKAKKVRVRIYRQAIEREISYTNDRLTYHEKSGTEWPEGQILLNTLCAELDRIDTEGVF